MGPKTQAILRQFTPADPEAFYFSPRQAVADFHADLKAICRKFRENSEEAIMEMQKEYNLKLDPEAQKKATDLLGTTGKFAGADRRTRIELLRSLGFPEPVILEDQYKTYERHQIGVRMGRVTLEIPV